MSEVMEMHTPSMACEDCRIAITTDGVEVDSSTGDIALEAMIVVGILLLVSAMYVGKKWIDKKFN
jgi:LPXTG-motif cell wall-anchored protein|tara:strand:+ start:507 stop:701 length:195 start_codon:yes stop_codon:yes gene_type:complete